MVSDFGGCSRPRSEATGSYQMEPKRLDERRGVGHGSLRMYGWLGVDMQRRKKRQARTPPAAVPSTKEFQLQADAGWSAACG